MFFQNNSLFQETSFAYREPVASPSVSFSCSLTSLPSTYPSRFVAAGRLIEYTRGQCSLHNTGVSRKWRHAEALRASEPRELAMLMHPATTIQTHTGTLSAKRDAWNYWQHMIRVLDSTTRNSGRMITSFSSYVLVFYFFIFFRFLFW